MEVQKRWQEILTLLLRGWQKISHTSDRSSIPTAWSRSFRADAFLILFDLAHCRVGAVQTAWSRTCFLGSIIYYEVNTSCTTSQYGRLRSIWSRPWSVQRVKFSTRSIWNNREKWSVPCCCTLWPSVLHLRRTHTVHYCCLLYVTGSDPTPQHARRPTCFVPVSLHLLNLVTSSCERPT